MPRRITWTTRISRRPAWRDAGLWRALVDDDAEIDAVGMFDTTVEQQGKVFVTTELGGGGTATAATVSIALRGARNVLRHAGILSGPVEGWTTVACWTCPTMPSFHFAPQGGLLHPGRSGSGRGRGQPLACIWPVDRTGIAPVTVLREPPWPAGCAALSGAGADRRPPGGGGRPRALARDRVDQVGQSPAGPDWKANAPRAGGAGDRPARGPSSRAARQAGWRGPGRTGHNGGWSACAGPAACRAAGRPAGASGGTDRRRRNRHTASPARRPAAEPAVPGRRAASSGAARGSAGPATPRCRPAAADRNTGGSARAVPGPSPRPACRPGNDPRPRAPRAGPRRRWPRCRPRHRDRPRASLARAAGPRSGPSTSRRAMPRGSAGYRSCADPDPRRPARQVLDRARPDAPDGGQRGTAHDRQAGDVPGRGQGGPFWPRRRDHRRDPAHPVRRDQAVGGEPGRPADLSRIALWRADARGAAGPGLGTAHRGRYPPAARRDAGRPPRPVGSAAHRGHPHRADLGRADQRPVRGGASERGLHHHCRAPRPRSCR